ncbi:putative ATP-grasp-modified RiPP [Streptomyces sp. JJ66]|nr:putative ATP-grasp-modified RiPP [Streptomyces sp. JJ66]
MFPYPSNTGTGSEAEPVVPFGITKAVPIERPQIDSVVWNMRLCPERQVSLTEEGEPFAHAPSMGSTFATVSETVEDMQVFTDNEGTDND